MEGDVCIGKHDFYILHTQSLTLLVVAEHFPDKSRIRSVKQVC